MNMTGKNRYFLLRVDAQATEIDLHDYKDPDDEIYLGYYIEALRIFDAICPVHGLEFYIVWDSYRVTDLPVYGDNVVALLLLDEYRTLPHYAGRIGYIFKPYGFRPWLSASLRGKTISYGLKLTKDCACWSRAFLTYRVKSGFRSLRINREVVPLGYARQKDTPIIPFAERRYDLSFIGSIEQQPASALSLRSVFGTPKNIARTRMILALNEIGKTYRGEIYCVATSSFRSGIRSDGREYSQIMADTKICLSPRGSSVETYRFFEAMRQGCVVICDRLPPHWFYSGSPAIQIDDWRDLPEIVADLERDPERLADLHRKSLSWWTDICSEKALAYVLSERITQAYPRQRDAEGPSPEASGAVSRATSHPRMNSRAV